MQRCFFLIFILVNGWINAQQADISKTLVSFRFSPRDLDSGANSDRLAASAEITVSVKGHRQVLILEKSDLQIKRIRQRVGRLTGEVPFFVQGDSLTVDISVLQSSGEHLQLNIEYEIPWKSESYNTAVQLGNAFVAFNGFNLQEGLGAGRAGHFFPTLAGDAFRLELNVTFPRNMNSNVPATFDFMTDNQDGTISHYWTSRNEISSENFYLLVGKFEEADPEELAEEFNLVEFSRSRVVAGKVRPRLQDLLAFAGIDEDPGDSVWTAIDSISKLPLPGYYLSPEDVNTLSPPDLLLLQKATLLIINGNDTAQSDRQLMAFYRQFGGKSWYDDFLEKKWTAWETSPEREKRKTLELKLEAWKEENKFLQQLDPRIIDSAFLQPVLQSLELPYITVWYAYRASDTAQFVNYEQDTSLGPAYTLPVEIKVLTEEKVIRKPYFLDKVKDEIRLRTGQSPDFAGVDFGAHFPGRVTDKRPDTYNLYMLAHAATRREKKDALLRLFHTSNANLFSTALGIAMDDEDAALRLQALQEAGRLNASGRQKLRETILGLAQSDPDPAVRKEARELVAKYYPDK